MLLEKLSKVGGTDFVLSHLVDETEGTLFLNPSELNELRRLLLMELRNKIVASRKPTYRFDPSRYFPVQLARFSEEKCVVELSKAEEIKKCVFADRFVITPDLYTSELIKEAVKVAAGRKCYLRFPKIVREKELSALKELVESVSELGIYADDLYAVGLARALARPYIAGFGLNIFNEEAAALFKDADLICGSVEHPFHGDLVYRAGKVPLMSFAHCPVSVVYKRDCAACDQSISRLVYRNEDHRYLILRRRFSSCDFTMLEDKVTLYPLVKGKSRFYSLIGLNAEEKNDMIECVSEDNGEQ